MKRRFYASPLEVGKVLLLSGPEARHLEVVLRASIQEKIILFDGKGKEGEGVIQEIRKGKIQVFIEKVEAVEREVSGSIHLGICLPKEKAWDLALKSAVELGVSSITPLLSERSLPMPLSKGLQKDERWKVIIQEACKQCGGNQFPILHPLCSLEDFWQEGKEKICLWGDPQGRTMAEVLSDSPSPEYSILIGPEGGFSEKERHFLQEKQCRPVSLGPRILRVETAVTAMVSRLLFWMEIHGGMVGKEGSD